MENEKYLHMILTIKSISFYYFFLEISTIRIRAVLGSRGHFWRNCSEFFQKFGNK